MVPFCDEPCNFVGEFKVGDNLSHNSLILEALVESNRDGNLNKPIVLQVSSMLEACLQQIVYRAQNFNREGVPKMSEADQKSIAGKRIDKFALVIDILRKYEVLGSRDHPVYEQMHFLRRLRNRIHIQECVSGLPNNDDAILFSERYVKCALGWLRWTVCYLNKELARPQHIQGYVANLRVPAEIPKI